MTVTELARYARQNDKVQTLRLTSKIPNGHLPPKGHVNPYCPEGMDITGRTDFRRIVPVDEGVANKIKSLAFESMEKNGGMSDGEIESEIIKNYVMSLPPEERAAAGWTLNQISLQEADRLGEYVHQRDPPWNWGKPVKPGILDGYRAGMESLRALQPDRFAIRIDTYAAQIHPAWAETLSSPSNGTGKGLSFVDFTESGVSTKALELASRMAETPVGVEVSLVCGMSMRQIADVCGGIGRAMDEALATGEISQREYDDLSRGLDSYTSFLTETAEKKNAMLYVLRQNNDALLQKIAVGALDEAVAGYAEQVRNSWPEQIREFLKDNSYDRAVLKQMITTVRRGESLSFCIEA